MTTVWIVRGQETLLAASRSRDIVHAQREWKVTWAFHDLGAAVSECGLCGHPDIRYRYEIENPTTRRHLWVGSECIKKFIPVTFDGREVKDEQEKGRILDRVSTDARRRGRQKRAYDVLDGLAKHDRRFGDRKWRDDWQLGYSVKQLKWIAVAAKNASLPFDAGDFRINTRRGRVMEQLYALEEWQYLQLRPALAKSRVSDADRHFGFVGSKDSWPAF